MPWILSVVMAILLINLYLSNYVLQLSRIAVPLPRLPAVFAGLRVVLLSDWHDARFGPNSGKLLGIVRGESPDLIAMTGDFVERLSEFPHMETLCRGLVAIAPTYYVTGNHEWVGRVARQAREVASASGVICLDNKHDFITRTGQSICIVGIEDPADQLTLSEVTARARLIGGDPFVVMLCHRYDRWTDFVEQRIDLALTGHAHGGMIRLPFTDGVYGPGHVLFPKRTSGVNRQDGVVMVTSRGLGNPFKFPLRLFNRPEVVSLTLEMGAS